MNNAEPNRSHATRLAATAVACLLWGGSLVASKSSYDSMGPFSLGLVRFTLSALLLFALLGIDSGRRRHAGSNRAKRLRGRDMVICAVTGLVGTTLYFAAENYGVMLLPASMSSLVTGAFPAMTLALECCVDRTRPSSHKAAGMLLAFVGVGTIALTEGLTSGGNLPLGIAVLLLGGLCWAIYNVIMRYLGDYPVLEVTAWQTLFGAVGFVPLALVEGLPAAAPSPSVLLSLAYLVAGCTVAGFVLYNFGLAGLSPSTAASLVNLIPVFGLVLAAAILHEPVGPQEVVGGALVVAGTFLSSRE